MTENQKISPWYALDMGRTGDVVRQAQSFEEIPLLAPLLDAVPDIIVVINEGGRIVFANDALRSWVGLRDKGAIYGKLTGQVLGCKYATVGDGCGTREICRTCGAAQTILSSLQGQHAVNECRITQHTGQALDLRVLAAPLRFNEHTYSVFTLQDISDEKRRAALERIFFHDILNLAGTLSLASHSLSFSAEPERLDKIHDIIHQISARLIELIKSNRDLSRAESGELQPSSGPVSSMQLLQQVCAFYEMSDFAYQRLLEISPEAEDVVFMSDRALLERVLGNMVKNALEASDPGQTVSLDCGTDGERVWFEVHNATFMARHIQLQVFQRSFSTKGEGRGLGTYSIKLLTERYLHGSVEFESTVDEGTTFRVFYPLEP